VTGLVVIIGLYFILVGFPAAGADYDAFVLTLKKYGVKEGNFSEGVDSINNLSGENLESLELELGALSEQATEAWLKDLAVIYRDAAELELTQRQLQTASLKAQIASGGPCDNIAYFTEMSEKAEKISIISKALFENTSGFLNSYPDKTDEFGLMIMPSQTGLSKIQQGQRIQSGLISALEEECK